MMRFHTVYLTYILIFDKQATWTSVAEMCFSIDIMIPLFQPGWFYPMYTSLQRIYTKHA